MSALKISDPTQIPPIAKIVPTQLEKHGHVRTDNYYWLKERDDPAVIAYLEAENAYTEAMMAPTADLQETLYQEIKARIKQTDTSVPYKRDGYYYYTRTEDGREYPIYCRKRGTLDAPEQVLVDANLLAEGHGFLSVGSLAVSPDGNILAYPVDTVGRRFYTIAFVDLSSGELLADAIPNVTGNKAWAADNRTLFYTKQDPTTLRAYQVYRHTLGTDPAADVLVYQESDETFSCTVRTTKSKRYILIASHQTVSTEVLYLEADDPQGEFRVLQPRRRDHEYDVDHYGDYFYIRTNHEAKNFCLKKTPVNQTGVDQTGLEHWQTVIPHREDVLLEGFELLSEHLVVVERRQALVQMCVHPWATLSGGEPKESAHYIDFGEPA